MQLKMLQASSSSSQSSSDNENQKKSSSLSSGKNKASSASKTNENKNADYQDEDDDDDVMIITNEESDVKPSTSQTSTNKKLPENPNIINNNNNNNIIETRNRRRERAASTSSASTLNNGSSSETKSRESTNESSDSDEFEQKRDSSKEIKIGPEYQVDLALYANRSKDIDSGKKNQKNAEAEMETLVWKPTSYLTEKQIEDFLFEATSKHSYSIEQGLALLFWNKYDIAKSLEDMHEYIPVPNEWSREDKILFEQAYMFHGKNFNKIRQVLPDKTQANLVSYYYSWKKTRNYVSHIDNQQLNQKNQSNNLDENTDSNGANGDGNSNSNNGNEANDDSTDTSSENESNDENFTSNINNICCNCDLITVELSSTPKGMLCTPCYGYWKSTGGLMRPDSIKPSSYNNNHATKINRFMNNINSVQASGNGSDQLTSNKHETARNFHKTLRRPPKGIYMNFDELVSLAESDSDQIFDVLTRRFLFLKKEIQKNKQEINVLLPKLSNDNEFKVVLDEDMLKFIEETVPTPGWTPKEISLALQGFNKYGDNFEAISQVIVSKNEASIKAFYNYYRENFGLDKMINNHPKELLAKANQIYNSLDVLNAPDLPVDPNDEISKSAKGKPSQSIAASFINESLLNTTSKINEASTASFAKTSNTVASVSKDQPSTLNRTEEVIFIDKN